jgi:hypothetical protein
MPGSYAANLKEGSRSEILADYLFSQWGAVTPVRRQDDTGIDLFCTLADRVGQRAIVREYFVVQVKSETAPWIFDDQESVDWLIRYPTPLFLACVDKKQGSVSVYHVTPRFYLWALGNSPDRLVLTPEEREDGEFVQWQNGQTFSLSAPIIRVNLSDLISDDTMSRLRVVFRRWVEFDRENCELVSQGLLRFRMPHSYRVNEIPHTGIGEVGNAVPEPQFLRRGILKLAEGGECIGGQLFRQGDRVGALRATLLVYHLWKTYPEVFEGSGRWTGILPGDMGMLICKELNEAAEHDETPDYVFRGLDAVEKTLEGDSVAKRFVSKK